MIELTLRVANSIGDVAAEAWDACANPAWPDRGNGAGSPCPTAANLQSSALGDRYNPFISHDFLSALEQSQSVRARAGWQPFHLLAEDAKGALLGAVPCYVKSHSRGEYVFDHGWADAYERAGGRYYPKLQVAVPFTPATGPRLLIREGVEHERIRSALASGLVALCGMTKASSVHVTFAREAEWKFLAAQGFLQRNDQQFHWRNRGYGCFEDFLNSLNSRHRKAIRRERREALADGITIHALTGNDVTEEAWDAFFAFYMQTGSRKWRRPALAP